MNIYIVVTTSATREDDAYDQSVKVFTNEKDARSFFRQEYEGIEESLRLFNDDEGRNDREIYFDITENEANIINNDLCNPEIWQVNFYSQTIN